MAKIFLLILFVLSLTACGTQGETLTRVEEPLTQVFAATPIPTLPEIKDVSTISDEDTIYAICDAYVEQYILLEIEEIEEENYLLVSETELPARRFTIAIDPGHQGRGNYTREPNGPGSSTYKARVSSGTRGVATGVPEFELVLTVSLLLRDELVSRGYEVFMIRECHNVDISNAERAQMATEVDADVFLRIHANGSANQSVNGIMTISHTRNNPYIPHLYEESRRLSDLILSEMLETTGANSRGVWETDTMTGSNWATMPVTIVEMGYMTNPEEDRLMQTLEYQLKLVEGIANGVDLFFMNMQTYDEDYPDFFE